MKFKTVLTICSVTEPVSFAIIPEMTGIQSDCIRVYTTKLPYSQTISIKPYSQTSFPNHLLHVFQIEPYFQTISIELYSQASFPNHLSFPINSYS